MSFATVTRRGFLKGACMLSGGILLGIRMTGKAAAAVKAFKESTVPTNNSPKELPKTTRKCGHCTNPISASRSAINRKNCCIPNGLTNPARSRS